MKAALNICDISSTFWVFQVARPVPLNASACRNVFDMLVTEPVSQPDKSALKASAYANLHCIVVLS